MARKTRLTISLYEDDDDCPRPQFGKRTAFHLLENLPISSGPWYESPAEIEAAFRATAERERRVAWMLRRIDKLPPVERSSVRFHYFEGLSYRDAGLRLGLNASSVLRAAERGLRRLREAASRETARR